MENTESFIISVKNSSFDDRRRNVLQNLIPRISEIVNVSIFDAITPKDLKDIRDLVIHETISIRRGIDKNLGVLTSLKNCSLTLGHYKLFQYSVLNNKNLLIFEDDSEIDLDNFNKFEHSLKLFERIQEPSILYLQSECPWGYNPYPQINGRSIRDIPKQFLNFDIDKNLYKLKKDWWDVAGTTCYCINPSGSYEMLNIINQIGLLNIDQLTQKALNQGVIKFYLPESYQSMTYLRKEQILET